MRRRRSLGDIVREFIERIEEEIEELFEEELWDPTRREITPLADIYETPDEVIVTFDLPFVKSLEDIDLDLSYDSVSIKAKLCEPIKYENWIPRYRDIDYNCWTKEVKLPTAVNHSKAKIRFKNGILEIRLPKLKKRKIRVE